MCGRKGVSLVEVLIGLLIVVIASIATLRYFAYGLGSVNKQGNRRAALERARERLEQLMAVSSTTIKPTDTQLYFVKCNAVGVCGPLALAADPTDTVLVDDLSGQPIRSTVQCVHDSVAGTPAGTCDVLELSARVWFIPGSSPTLGGVDDNDFRRVHIRTLRTPL